MKSMTFDKKKSVIYTWELKSYWKLRGCNLQKK